MLTQETIQRIASDYGLTAEDFQAKIASEKEETVELPEGKFYTEKDLNTRDSNKYNEAKKAYEEMTVKKIRDEKGYDFEGKTFDNLFAYHDEKLKEKYSKGTSERVKELEQDLEKIRKSSTELETTYKSQISELKESTKKESLKASILGMLPETTIDKEDVVMLFMNKYAAKEDEDGKTYFEKDGVKLKDEKVQSYLGLKEIVPTFVEPYRKKTPGRGGGNKFGGKEPSNEMDFINQWESENGSKISSPEGVNALVAFNKKTA